MVNVTVDNEVISHRLNINQSLTIPAGQVWKVCFSSGSRSPNHTKINEVPAMTTTTDGGNPFQYYYICGGGHY